MCPHPGRSRLSTVGRLQSIHLPFNQPQSIHPQSIHAQCIHPQSIHPPSMIHRPPPRPHRGRTGDRPATRHTAARAARPPRPTGRVFDVFGRDTFASEAPAAPPPTCFRFLVKQAISCSSTVHLMSIHSSSHVHPRLISRRRNPQTRRPAARANRPARPREA